ncbi:multimerin-2 isoform X1 [Pipistrellus kuhlii]|uniref:Multimerin 2 n=1 Tax=Pipistrellus kuhlii TaxID=59472 RepID=A0A7J7T0G9_PIPKU|nr:multimerin-2 isoform X1 [Pipistrellus kuhlii]KAF6294161.1 multimerin 2 [Pipistrellus kuhlii]
MILTLLLSLGGALGWGLLGASAQAPGPKFSEPPSPGLPGAWRPEAEDISSDRRNWCPYQKSRLVTFVAACKTEKFLVHSQQPCPQGAPCQGVSVMYRVAARPVYRVRQKVLAAVAWSCCPGFAGPDCQQHDPTAVPGADLQEPWAGPAGEEPAAEPGHIGAQRERLLRDLQNDVHHTADSPADGPASNLTAAATEADEGELEFLGQSPEQVLPLGPDWSGFNQSLHSLFEAVRNLSLGVEANRQAISTLRDGAVPRADFQELGAKFEAKVQENSRRAGQLQRDLEDGLQAQRLSLQRSLAEVQADVDAKLKRLLKAQEHLSNASLAAAAAGAGARPEPESLQARLSQLQRNVSALHQAAGHREEALQGTLADMQATLDRHVEEIKELYSESDETFDQISAVEQQVEKLRGTQQELRELRVALMEKSLIAEENKVDADRQLLELNLTLQHLQGGLADLVKYVTDCGCQGPPGGPEGPGNATRAPERVPGGPGAGPAPRAAEREAAVWRALEERRAEAQQAGAERARLRTQLRALGGQAAALQAAQGELRRAAGELRASFAALLADALRHEALLAALFGEDAVAAEAPGPLALSYEQIRAGLRDAALGLHEQARGWAALAARVAALERAGGAGPAGPELQRLGADVRRLERCCGDAAAGNAALNGSLQGLHAALAGAQLGLRRQQQLFHSLFANFQGLLAANASLDLGRLQAVLGRREKKEQRGLDAARRRDKKQAAPRAPGAAPQEAGSPVAFYAGSSGGMAAPQTLRFDAAHINVGSSFSPEDGYFRAPERGVYLLAVSIDFGPGPGAGQLVLGGHRRLPIAGGGTATAFTMAELQKGERVWVELTQGSVRRRSPPGTAFGGFLLFKT